MWPFRRTPPAPSSGPKPFDWAVLVRITARNYDLDPTEEWVADLASRASAAAEATGNDAAIDLLELEFANRTLVGLDREIAYHRREAERLRSRKRRMIARQQEAA